MNIATRENLLPLTPQMYHILVALLGYNVMSGADVIRQIREDSRILIEPSTGTVYPALRRLKAMRMVTNPTGDPNIYQISEHGIELLLQETKRLKEAAKLAEERARDWAARPESVDPFVEIY
jgi:DNA-binding PadR family transcriptional regulator